MTNTDRNDDIYKVIDEITDYLEPLNFVKEIDGTLYAVRTFFKEDATENITEKVERIILKKQ